MYKVLNIDGQEYKLEYSIEASLYADCVSNLTCLMADIGMAEDNKDVKGILHGMSNVPQTALVLFYAGLMEAHGRHSNGDGRVPDLETAKRLIAKYIKEKADTEDGNFYSIMEMCINQMTEDGFFKLVGLDRVIQAGKAKTKKVPQDHKKASAK